MTARVTAKKHSYRSDCNTVAMSEAERLREPLLDSTATATVTATANQEAAVVCSTRKLVALIVNVIRATTGQWQ